MNECMFRLTDKFVPRQVVREKMREIDPVGVENRKHKAIRRKEYESNGPYDCWHIDGNHKFRRFRLCIHGAVDGFTRLVVMMNCNDNNRAFTVLAAYSEAVNIHGFPNFLYMDKGTENVRVIELHESVHGPGSVNTGSSTRYGLSSMLLNAKIFNDMNI